MLSTATFQQEYDRIKELQDLPTYVSKDHLLNELLFGTLVAVAAISLLFCVMISVVTLLVPPSKQATQSNNNKNREWAYQLTNMLVNGIMGVMGVYYYINVLEPNPTVDDLVVGYWVVWPLACLQLGKNLWSLPLGILGIVHESPAKLGHHLAVVVVVTASSIFTMGFRYYGPFLFGMLELSSVPLAILLIFKYNEGLIHQYPREYTLIRMVFMVSFLYIRWYLYLPLKIGMLRLVAFTVLTSDSPFYHVFGVVIWISMFFIASLQVYWGLIILKGFSKFVIKASSSSKTMASPSSSKTKP